MAKAIFFFTNAVEYSLFIFSASARRVCPSKLFSLNRCIAFEKIPAECAMFIAVSNLSPVIIHTRMPASKNRFIDSGTLSAKLSSIALHPSNTSSFSTSLCSSLNFIFLSWEVMARLYMASIS